MLKPTTTSGSTSTRIEEWHLESPGMFMNHSCDPSVIITSYDWTDGEGIAARNIQEGDELTCDYAFFDYEEAGTVFECACGATQCRGKRIGFHALTESEKTTFLAKGTQVSPAVLARHHHSMGQGPPVRVLQPPTLPRTTHDNIIPRLVIPGPSCADAQTITIRPCQPTIQNDTVDCGLFATRQIQAGKRVYWFWAQPWPLPGMKPPRFI
jgi:SET domain